MTGKLSIFEWNDENSEGFGDTIIGYFNNSEIDLSDKEALKLANRIFDTLTAGQHVTLRVDEVIK